MNGLVGIDIMLTKVNEMLSDHTIGEEGFVTLLAGDGTFVYHPNKDVQLKNVKDIDISSERRHLKMFVSARFCGSKKRVPFVIIIKVF